KELHSGKILKEALKINGYLNSLNAMINAANVDINKTIDLENKASGKTLKPTKGNFTWYNFDKSVKVEVSINETIKFDESKIASAREKLDAFITKNVQGTDDIVRQLINSAFANTKGGLDSKKVMSLLKYRSKIKDKGFQAALDLIEDSITRPSSKRYFRVWAKDESNQYKNIDLNFSSI
ncbi:MAG: DUF3164 family protein, partial [Bacteroidota bacterium]